MSHIETTLFNYDFIVQDERQMYIDAHNAIDQAEAWEYLKNRNPNECFMFGPKNSTMDLVNYHFLKTKTGQNISGAFYGAIMRRMLSVAQVGYEKYKDKCLGARFSEDYHFEPK